MIDVMDPAESLTHVIKLYPNLTRGGFTTNPKDAICDDQLFLKEFRIACDFLDLNGFRSGREREGYYSYRLKHDAERWTEEKYGPPRLYVSNGAMIAAAISRGWSAKSININAWLKLPKGWPKSPRDLSP
jgi:hypothetical protein